MIVLMIWSGGFWQAEGYCASPWDMAGKLKASVAQFQMLLLKKEIIIFYVWSNLAVLGV